MRDYVRFQAPAQYVELTGQELVQSKRSASLMSVRLSLSGRTGYVRGRVELELGGNIYIDGGEI